MTAPLHLWWRVRDDHGRTGCGQKLERRGAPATFDVNRATCPECLTRAHGVGLHQRRSDNQTDQCRDPAP